MTDTTETIDRKNAIEAWHFLPEDRRLRWETREIIETNSIVSVDPPLKLCTRGLHASVRPIDALEYAPGPIICRVQIWGDVIHGADKLCGQYRRVLWMADATQTLHRFACEVATAALDLVESRGGQVDPRSREAIKVKMSWIKCEASNDELGAAWDAAKGAFWNAVSAAASAAAWAAVSAASWAAVWASAWGAIREAARVAAWATTSAVAGDASRADQNRKLHDMLISLNETK